MFTKSYSIFFGIIIFLSLFSVCEKTWPANTRNISSKTYQQKVLRQEPSFSQVLKAYYAHCGFDSNRLNQLKKRIRTAPYLPVLYVGYDHSLKEAETFSVDDNVSVSGGIVTLGPEENAYDYDNNLGRVFRARAVWKLDEIIFNRNDLLFENEVRDQVKLKKELSDDLYKVFEERKLLLSKCLSAKRKQSKDYGLYFAKYLALTENLDALTGNVFHENWWKGNL